MFNVTRERIRQIEAKALAKLKASMARSALHELLDPEPQTGCDWAAAVDQVKLSGIKGCANFEDPLPQGLCNPFVLAAALASFSRMP